MLRPDGPSVKVILMEIQIGIQLDGEPVTVYFLIVLLNSNSRKFRWIGRGSNYIFNRKSIGTDRDHSIQAIEGFAWPRLKLNDVDGVRPVIGSVDQIEVIGAERSFADRIQIVFSQKKNHILIK